MNNLNRVLSQYDNISIFPDDPNISIDCIDEDFLFYCNLLSDIVKSEFSPHDISLTKQKISLNSFLSDMLKQINTTD